MVKIEDKGIIMKIFYWILFIFIIYLTYEIIKKILGGSLGFESLVVGLLLINIGFTFSLHSKLSGHLGWHKGRDTKR